MKRRRTPREDRPPGDHSPDVSEEHKVTVRRQWYSGWTWTTLADVEAFTAELRKLGAPGKTVMHGAVDLHATLNLKDGSDRLD